MSHRTWKAKFGDAFRGLYHGTRGQSSFVVHFVIATAVIVAGFVFHVTMVEWCILTACIAGVVAAELFNTALESLAKAITPEHNELVGRALDMASAAVLVAAIGSVVIGLLIFLPHLLQR